MGRIQATCMHGHDGCNTSATLIDVLCELLAEVSANDGRVLQYGQLLQWGGGRISGYALGVILSHMRRLRRKLGQAGRGHQ